MYNKEEYNKDYTKNNYKRVQVYIQKKDYEKIEKYLKTINPKLKMSGYIKELIEKDLLEKSGGGIWRVIDFFVNVAIKFTEIIAWVIEKIGNLLSLFR